MSGLCGSGSRLRLLPVRGSQALDAAGGDWDAAGVILRPLLEAIGALTYEPGLPRRWTGRPVQLREKGNAS